MNTDEGKATTSGPGPCQATRIFIDLDEDDEPELVDIEEEAKIEVVDIEAETENELIDIEEEAKNELVCIEEVKKKELVDVNIEEEAERELVNIEEVEKHELVDIEGESDESVEDVRGNNMVMLKKNLWLVRIPLDVSSEWETLKDNTKVGMITLTKDSNLQDVTEIGLTLDADLVSESRVVGSIFDKYKLCKTPVAVQANNGIVAAWVNNSKVAETETDTMELKLTVGGTIKERYKTFPIRDDTYREHSKVKQELMRISKQPIQLRNAVNCYKPVSNHRNNIEYEKKKKQEGRKTRGEQEDVAQQLFQAFETHQYYTFKDLVKLTNQPAGFLKQILNDYCNYSTKGVHRSYWELKPEYRHYSTEDEIQEKLMP